MRIIGRTLKKYAAAPGEGHTYYPIIADRFKVASIGGYYGGTWYLETAKGERLAYRDGVEILRNVDAEGFFDAGPLELRKDREGYYTKLAGPFVPTKKQDVDWAKISEGIHYEDELQSSLDIEPEDYAEILAKYNVTKYWPFFPTETYYYKHLKKDFPDAAYLARAPSSNNVWIRLLEACEKEGLLRIERKASNVETSYRSKTEYEIKPDPWRSGQMLQVDKYINVTVERECWTVTHVEPDFEKACRKYARSGQLKTIPAEGVMR